MASLNRLAGSEVLASSQHAGVCEKPVSPVPTLDPLLCAKV